MNIVQVLVVIGTARSLVSFVIPDGYNETEFPNLPTHIRVAFSVEDISNVDTVRDTFDVDMDVYLEW